jgi:hypothetical protein
MFGTVHRFCKEAVKYQKYDKTASNPADFQGSRRKSR